MKSKVMRKMLALAMALLMLWATGMPALAVGKSSTLAEKGDWYTVYCGKLNVREGASAQANVRRLVRRGTQVMYLGSEKGWWLVQLPDGSRGYVDKQFLTPVHVPGPRWYVTIQKLNLRSTPRRSGHRVKAIPKGESVYISAANGDWGYAHWNGYEGWVALKYVG